VTARNVRNLLNRATAAQQMGRPELGLTFAARAAAIEPGDAYVLSTLSWLQQCCSLHEDALKTAQRAIAADPEYEWPHRLRGWSLWVLGRREAATDAMAEAVRVAPSVVEGLRRFAWFASLVGRGEEALEAGQRAVELDPADTDAWFALGWAGWAVKRWDLAEQALTEAVRLSPASSHNHNNLGALYAKLGRYEEAIDRFERAIQLNPASEWAYQNTAYCLRSLGRWEEAFRFEERDALNRLHDAEKRLRDHVTPALLTTRAQALRDLRRDDEAHDVLEQAVELATTPDEAMKPLRVLADSKVRRQDDDAARRIGKRLLADYPGDGLALATASWIGWLTATPELAERAHATAAEQGLDPVVVADCAAEAALARNDLQESRRHIHRQLDLTRNLRPCCPHAKLALIAHREGDTANAAEHIREAERGEPNCTTLLALRVRQLLPINTTPRSNIYPIPLG
jgi:tetratricopeptide (TPR) repeat protein